jgi:TRAP-type C4-dicarboxylate transport system permease small subunit
MKHIDFLSRRVGHIASYFFLVSLFITCLEVFLRYAFNAPTSWAFETSVALSASAILLAGPATMQLRQHIAITAIYQIIPLAWVHRLKVSRSIFALVVCAGFTWAGWTLGITALTTWETSGSGWDAPIPALVKPLIFVSCGLMTLQAFRNVMQDIFSKPGSKENFI